MSSPLVQDIETKRENALVSSYRSFLNQKASDQNQASIRFYHMVDGHLRNRYSNRLEECRTRAWFVRNKDTGKVRVAAKQCRLRWCFHCSEARQQFITQAVSSWWNKAVNPKLLTVTIRHSSEPLHEQIAFLYKSFSKFRNCKLLKSRIKGGVWFFQVTYNKKTKQWHPHIHALIDSAYIDHTALMLKWYKITRTSNIVHIRAVHDPDKTLSHNARYAARPSALLKIPEELWPEIHDAFNGKRICGSWGTAKEISLRPHKPDDCDRWENIGNFNTVANLRGSSYAADQIWKAWLDKCSIDPQISIQEVDDFVEDYERWEHPPPKRGADPSFDWNDKKASE